MPDLQWDRGDDRPAKDKREFGARSLALSSDTFRTLAHQLSNFTADYLEELPQLPSYPQEVSGRRTEELFGGDAPWKGSGVDAFEPLPKVFEASRPASPRFFGYVFGSGEPVGSLGNFAASVLHQNATAGDLGQLQSPLNGRLFVGWQA